MSCKNINHDCRNFHIETGTRDNITTKKQKDSCPHFKWEHILILSKYICICKDGKLSWFPVSASNLRPCHILYTGNGWWGFRCYFKKKAYLSKINNAIRVRYRGLMTLAHFKGWAFSFEWGLSKVIIFVCREMFAKILHGVYVYSVSLDHVVKTLLNHWNWWKQHFFKFKSQLFNAVQQSVWYLKLFTHLYYAVTQLWNLM